MPSNEKRPGDESQVQADAKAAGSEQAAAPAADAAPAEAGKAADAAEAAPAVPKGVAVLKHESDASASASFRGEAYEPDEKGFLVVPLDAVVPLRAHGFAMVKKG